MEEHKLFINTRFPVYHSRAHEATGLDKKLNNLIEKKRNTQKLLHVFKPHYAEWAARFKQIADKTSSLTVCVYDTRPNRNIPITMCNLTSKHGIGLQKAIYNGSTLSIDGKEVPLEQAAKDSGLTTADFKEWIERYTQPESGKTERNPLACIQFTDFRY